MPPRPTSKPKIPSQNAPLREARVTFHGLAAGGEAVGRDEAGKTVFAPFAAPGEAARVQIEVEKPAFARGLVTQIETISPDRAAPFCPQFRPEFPAISCGGCAWQHVSLEAQRRAKHEIVASALRRIGGQNGAVPGDAKSSDAKSGDAKSSGAIEVESVRGGAGSGYRNKADFVIGRGEIGSRNGAKFGAEIGFFARESHDLVDAPLCPIQNPRNEEILVAAREILNRNPQWAFDARSGRGLWRRLVARVSSGGETLATLVLSGENAVSSDIAAQIARQLRERVPHLVGVIAAAGRGEEKLLWGQDFLMESVQGLEFRVTGGAFWQVNTEMTPPLAGAVLELAAVKTGERALDLFCGAGFFALPLARAGAQVTGIETHRGAIRDAIWNAEHNGLKADFRVGDAPREVARFGRGDFDLVVLDPPRSGARECLEALIRIAPSRLIYVSCDPATWARDARILGENGYQLRRAIPFDLFPQSAHVEVVSRFERL